MTFKGLSLGYRKDMIPIEITPGPGNYDLNTSIEFLSSKQLRVKILGTKRFPELKNTKTKLGPGSYDPKFDIHSSISLPTMTKSKRAALCFIKNKDIPGPAIYDIRTTILDKYKKIHSNKQSIIKLKLPPLKHKSLNISNTPGPGHYFSNNLFQKNIKKSPHNHSKKITKRADFNLNFNPGPADYSPQRKPNGPKFTFGHKTEPDKENLKKRVIPGPADYSLETSFDHISGFGNSFYKNGIYTFPKSPKGKKLFTDNKRNPGPGTYNLAKKEPFLKEYGFMSFGTSVKNCSYTSFSNIPGPGSYIQTENNFKEKKQKGFSLSTAVKNWKIKKSFKKITKAIAPKFTKKIYCETPQNKKREVSASPKNDKINFNFKSLFDRKVNSETNIKLKKSGSFNLQMTTDSKKDNKNFIFPIEKLKKNNNFMGKGVRKLEFLENSVQKSPGPAGYSIERPINKKAIKIASSKRDDKYLIINYNPGAGSYNVPNSSFIAKKKKKKKINPNLLKLLNRIQMKAHPEKNKKKTEKMDIKTRKKNYKTVIKTVVA